MKRIDPGSPDSHRALPSPGSYGVPSREERSEASLRHILGAKLRSLGPLNVHTVVARVDLANFLQSNGQWDAAQLEYDESLRWFRQLADEDDPHVLVLEYTKAQALLRQGDLEGAKALLLRICELNAGSRRSSSAFTLLFLDSLAATLVRLGDWDNARQVVMTLFELRRRGLSDGETPATLSTASVLVTNFLNRNDWVSALPVQEQAVAMLEAYRGPNDVDTLLASSLLAVMLLEAGHPARARVLLQSLTTRFSETFGRAQVETLRVFLLLAIVLEQEGDLVGARALLERSYAVVRGSVQPDPDIEIRIGTKLASVLIRLEDAAHAEGLLQELLPLCERTLGKHDATTWTNLNNLAVALCNLGQHVRAYRTLEELYRRKLNKWGGAHSDVIEAGKELLSLRAKLPGDEQLGEQLGEQLSEQRLDGPDLLLEQSTALADGSLMLRLRAFEMPAWKQ